jgi:hypothetical protein
MGRLEAVLVKKPPPKPEEKATKSWRKKPPVAEEEPLSPAVLRSRRNWLQLYSRHLLVKLQAYARRLPAWRKYQCMRGYKKLSLMRFYRELPVNKAYIILNANYYHRKRLFFFHTTYYPKQEQHDLTLRVSEIGQVPSLHPEVVWRLAANLLRQHISALSWQQPDARPSSLG